MLSTQRLPPPDPLTCFCSFAAGLINTFSGYGPLTVEWPGKDGKHPRCPPKGNVAKGNDELVGYPPISFIHWCLGTAGSL